MSVQPMYLVDTNIISEARKKTKANRGVRDFFKRALSDSTPLFMSVITVGELRRGVELIRYRGDTRQANLIEKWLMTILDEYDDFILPIDDEIAQLWGHLRTPNPENALDKLIAATALIHDLTVVSRNLKDFQRTGVRVINPFTS